MAWGYNVSSTCSIARTLSPKGLPSGCLLWATCMFLHVNITISWTVNRCYRRRWILSLRTSFLMCHDFPAVNLLVIFLCLLVKLFSWKREEEHYWFFGRVGLMRRGVLACCFKWRFNLFKWECLWCEHKGIQFFAQIIFWDFEQLKGLMIRSSYRSLTLLVSLWSAFVSMRWYN
jgi:hypothetical protein